MLVKRNALPLLTTYVVVIAVGIAMFFQARAFPGAHMGAASPGFFPQVVSALLILLGLLGILELRWERPPAAAISAPVFAGMVSAVGYIGLMHLIGYYPSTFLFAFLIMWLARQDTSILRMLVDAALITLVAFIFFSLLIDARLPAGIFVQQQTPVVS